MNSPYNYWSIHITEIASTHPCDICLLPMDLIQTLSHWDDTIISQATVPPPFSYVCMWGGVGECTFYESMSTSHEGSL